MFELKRKEIQELEDRIQEVLFSKEKQRDGKVMCAIFPSNGLYVASGVVREFNRQGKSIVDMYEYFREMKLGNYHDFCAALNIMNDYGKEK